jgi:dihydropteroate synthase
MLPPSLHFLLRGERPAPGTPCIVMGIVNVTPDSFSDGGLHADPDAAVAHALRLLAEGADILDIGGESTRPGAAPVAVEEELARVLPVVRGIRAVSDAPLSIDTRRASVARACIGAGADIINDVSALRDDPASADVARESGAPVVLMHMQGTPATMQQAPHYGNVLREVGDFLRERIAWCAGRGVTRVVVDPGIGFGKLLEHNIALLRGLRDLAVLDAPVLVGVSRKRFIGEITGAPTGARMGGSVAAALLAARRGAHIVRVHDVADTVSALRTAEAIEGEGAHAV